MAKTSRTSALLTNIVDIHGQAVPVHIRHHPRARRYVLRVDLTRGEVRVTAPRRGTLTEAVKFAQENRDWIAERLQEVPPVVPFEDGAIIPYRGSPHRVRHVAQRRGVVTLGGSVSEDALPEIHVAGDEAFLARRLQDWLRKRAQEDLSTRVALHAAVLDVRPARISIRDQSSRWGSCSETRSLSFSWRLILAPPSVLDYVAAHEVAHLVHMDHSKSYWKCLASVYPDYRTAIRWLEANGPTLHRYG